KGILDQLDNSRRRRALNAREILSILKEMQTEEKKDEEEAPKTKDISLQSLYFHLQKLEEAELIQTVTILRKGSHNTAYYGRTARIFLHTDPVKHEKKVSQAFAAIKQFVKVKNPDLNVEKLDDFRERYLNHEKQRCKRISKWFIQYESLIVENNIDLTSFFKFMEIIDTINPENIQILKELQETLKFESLP
ncbi:MAG: winged helix-turn-helix domain-containing protein, partial [Candidatus Hodarchaeota archaeon]